MPKKSQIKQEDLSDEEETTPIKVSVKEKKKRVMTPEMLEILKKAREKAIEVKKAIATPDKRLEHYKEKIKTTKAKEKVSKKELMKQAIREVESEEITPPPISRQLPVVPIPIKEVPKPELPVVAVEPPVVATTSAIVKKKMVKYIYEEETDDDEDRVVVMKKPKEPKPIPLDVGLLPVKPVPLKPLMKQPAFNSYSIFGNRR